MAGSSSPFVDMRVTAHAEGLGEFLAQADRLGEIGDRVVGLALVQIGGAAVEIGRADWSFERLPELIAPDSSVIAWS